MSKKRLLNILVSMCLLFSLFMTMTAMAATVTQDGLEVTISTSKDSYTNNERIPVTMTIKNTSDSKVEGIQPEIVLPSGLTLTEGTLKPDKIDLDAGASKTYTVAAKRTVTTTTLKKTTTTTSTTAAKTSDNTPVLFWGALTLIAAVILLVLVIKKKSRKNMLMLFLCTALIATVLIPIKAAAATESRTITASKSIKAYNISYTISGKVTYDHVIKYSVKVKNGSGDGNYEEGKKVTIKANKAPEGKHFTKWTVESGGVKLADAKEKKTTFKMPAKSVEVKANYAVNTYQITASAGENGSISPVGNVSVNYGDDKKFTFKPADGYQVGNVTVDGTNHGGIAQFTFSDVKSDHTLHVTFEKLAYGVTVNNGTGGGSYAWGDTVTIEANLAPQGQLFKGWKVESGGVTLADASAPKTTFTMPKNEVIVTAEYETTAYQITASAGENGSISPDGNVSVSHGGSQKFTFTPAEGYHVEDVKVDDVSQGSALEYEFTNISAEHKIDVSFAKDTYEVTVNNGDGGEYYAWGEEVVITADAAPAGQTFVSWTVAGDVVTLTDPSAQTTTFTMPKSNVEVTAEYASLKRSADDEAKKITGVKSAKNAADNLTYDLSGYANLSDGAIVNLVAVRTGAKSPGTKADLGASLSKGVLTLNANKVAGASDLTYVGLVYTVTIDDVTSEERTLDISSLFGKDTASGN